MDKTLIEQEILKVLRHKQQEAADVFIPPTNKRGYQCDVSGCSRPAYAANKCNAHYIRARKGLALELPIRARKRDDKCVVCGGKTQAKGGWGMCRQHYRRARYIAIKDAAINLFGGKCSVCGFLWPRAVMDFHHINDKQSSISYLLSNGSAKAISEELSKCVVICANCHRLEHSGRH